LIAQPKSPAAHKPRALRDRCIKHVQTQSHRIGPATCSLATGTTVAVLTLYLQFKEGIFP
jgi:hypothetical protein